jgi:hypothetical protein
MGNPNPDMSGLKPFEKGCSGNPAGKTSAHRKAEIAAAEKAALVSEILVTAVYDAVKDADTDTAREQIKGDVLKLLKDTQDRGFGSPAQKVDQTSSDGSMSPQNTSDAVLDALKRKHSDKGA